MNPHGQRRRPSPCRRKPSASSSREPALARSASTSRPNPQAAGEQALRRTLTSDHSYHGAATCPALTRCQAPGRSPSPLTPEDGEGGVHPSPRGPAGWRCWNPTPHPAPHLPPSVPHLGPHSALGPVTAPARSKAKSPSRSEAALGQMPSSHSQDSRGTLFAGWTLACSVKPLAVPAPPQGKKHWVGSKNQGPWTGSVGSVWKSQGTGLKARSWGLPWGSSGWDSVLPMQGARVRSLVGELDPACMPQLRSCVPQLKSRCSQINKY